MKLKDMLMLVLPKTRVHIILDENFNIKGVKNELFLAKSTVSEIFYVECVYIKKNTLYIEAHTNKEG